MARKERLRRRFSREEPLTEKWAVLTVNPVTHPTAAVRVPASLLLIIRHKIL